jgi:streptogramin lyase
MIDLLERADPAAGLHVDPARLRAKVDERIGVSAPLHQAPARVRRPWLIAAVSFVVVLGVAIPVLLRQERPSIYAPTLDGIADLPGFDEAIPLASGGLQLMAVDGDTIWVMTTLQNRLQRVSAKTGDIETTYTIGARIEGVVVGGGYVWLLSHDNGGEVLRFNPVDGAVELTIPAGGLPGWGQWLGEGLWVSNDQDELLQISTDGQIVSRRPGQLKGGEGLGYLWVNDPETGLISSLAEDGTLGEIVIPTYDGLETMSGFGVRQVAEAAGRLWLLDGDYPFGTNLSVFDPSTGELGSFGSLTFGLLDLAEFDGYLWVTSNKDHLLVRVDPETGGVRRFPMPGKVGGLVVADGSLWATLYHPGALVRLDTNELIESAEIVYDDWNRYPHRLLCTGNDSAGGPTVILEPSDWIDYGQWSYLQAQLSEGGYVVCANGYVDGEASPEQRAADLEEALAEAGLSGPYLLAATGDGVHAARLFANGRGDIAGVILIDPMPIGFQEFLDDLIPGSGGAPGSDLEEEVSASLTDFGAAPLVVIGQDPQAVFLSERFIETQGRETAEAVNDFWQDGLAFYAGLSTDSQSVVATGTGMDWIIWDRPDLVLQEILTVLGRAGAR